MKFSIIIPLFNESENIDQLNKELLESITIIKKKNNFDFEIIYVDDGSTDNTYSKLSKFKNSISTIIVQNKINLSQSKSILNGIDVSNYENIILMDGDLQNDPKDIIQMVEIYFRENSSVVHGYRKFRKDPYITKVLPSKIANFLVRKFTNSKIKDHGCSLKIFKKDIIASSNFFGDFHRLFAAQIDSQIKVIEIEVNHRPRSNGYSKYGFERIFKIMIDLIFINFVINRKTYFYSLGYIGLFCFFMSTITTFYTLYLKFFKNISFIETPLLLIVIFFALSGLIFFSIILIMETFKNLITNDVKNKDYNIK